MQGRFSFLFFLALLFANQVFAQKFKAISFYTGREDQAHISFMHEAHRFFSKLPIENNFIYDSTTQWKKIVFFRGVTGTRAGSRTCRPVRRCGRRAELRVSRRKYQDISIKHLTSLWSLAGQKGE